MSKDQKKKKRGIISISFRFKGLHGECMITLHRIHDVYIMFFYLWYGMRGLPSRLRLWERALTKWPTNRFKSWWLSDDWWPSASLKLSHVSSIYLWSEYGFGFRYSFIFFFFETFIWSCIIPTFQQLILLLRSEVPRVKKCTLLLQIKFFVAQIRVSPVDHVRQWSDLVFMWSPSAGLFFPWGLCVAR